MLWLSMVTAASATAGDHPVWAKKLIEYGWDVPTPFQLREKLAAMEKRPFDGLIFRLNGGHNAFVPQRLDPARFSEDERILRELPFQRFTDNFVLVWGPPPAEFDWFDDAQWDEIEANAGLLVGIAQAGRPRGICFDPDKDGEWFSYRIRAVGGHIQFWIGDKLVMTHDDTEYKSGHFAIQGHNPGMKIEAKDLFHLDLSR